MKWKLWFATTMLLCAAVDLNGATAQERAARNEVWRAVIRRQLYVPDTLPELKAKVWSTFSPTSGVLADRVTYQTADGMLVPAIVYRPDPSVVRWKGKLPGVVVVNGHGSDKFGWYALYSGMMFAKAGAMVVTYDLIGEGERNVDRKSRTGSHDKIVQTPPGVPPDDWGQRLAGLMQVDAMQAVSYLRSRDEVDPNRIAVVGYSLGSFVSGIAGALDTRIHAVVLSGGAMYDGTEVGNFDKGKGPCQAPPMRSLRMLGDRVAILYALNADRGPTLLMNGTADTVARMPDYPASWFTSVQERVAELNGSRKNVFSSIVYPGISHRTSWVNKDGVLWLNKQIHFAIWTEKEIANAPVTHVSEWAKANKVDIAEAYMREDREGGLQAVGAGFPGIERKDLLVLPYADWTSLKDQLTYEAWAEKALAAERATSKALGMLPQ